LRRCRLRCGRVCQRQTPGEALQEASHLLCNRFLYDYPQTPNPLFPETPGTGTHTAINPLLKTTGTVLTSETAPNVSGSNKPVSTKPVEFLEKGQTIGLAETQKTKTAVSDSNKNTATGNTEIGTAENRTAGKTTTPARETVLADETGTALTEAAKDAADKKKPRRDTVGAARRID
jgi:hypothetical protein